MDVSRGRFNDLTSVGGGYPLLDLLLKIKSRPGNLDLTMRQIAPLVDKGAYRPEPKAAELQASVDK